jgi:hypothetical protein
VLGLLTLEHHNASGNRGGRGEGQRRAAGLRHRRGRRAPAPRSSRWQATDRGGLGKPRVPRSGGFPVRGTPCYPHWVCRTRDVWA